MGALLKSMELLHPSMELLHPNMGTALEESMVETEATNLPLREVTIQPPYAAITRLRRSHNEVMERTEATPQRGVTIRPPSEATIQPPGSTTQQPNPRSTNHLHPHQRSMEDPRSMGSRARKSMQNRFEINNMLNNI